MSYKELIIAFICIQFRAKVISVHKDDFPDPSIEEQSEVNSHSNYKTLALTCQSLRVFFIKISFMRSHC